MKNILPSFRLGEGRIFCCSLLFGKYPKKQQKALWVTGNPINLRSRRFFPTLPFIGMTVLIPGLPVVIRYAADYGQTRKEKFQTWAGLQWSSSGASALPKQPPSSVLQSLPFTVCPGSPLLTRSPLSLVAGRQEYGFASKTVWFVLLSVLPFSLFSASPNVLFSQLHLRSFVFERQIYFGGWIRKSSGLRPLS